MKSGIAACSGFEATARRKTERRSEIERAVITMRAYDLALQYSSS